MISERISNDTPSQIKILNIVIPILMHFCRFVSNWSVANRTKATSHPTKCDVINAVKQFPTDILSQIFDVIQSDVALQKQVH